MRARATEISPHVSSMRADRLRGTEQQWVTKESKIFYTTTARNHGSFDPLGNILLWPDNGRTAKKENCHIFLSVDVTQRNVITIESPRLSPPPLFLSLSTLLMLLFHVPCHVLRMWPSAMLFLVILCDIGMQRVVLSEKSAPRAFLFNQAIVFIANSWARVWKCESDNCSVNKMSKCITELYTSVDFRWTLIHWTFFWKLLYREKRNNRRNLLDAGSTKQKRKPFWTCIHSSRGL